MNVEIDNTFWEKVYPDILKATLSTKLRFFHYKIINRKLIANILQTKWKIVQDDKCYFYKKDSESIEHLLWECRKV